MNRVLLSLLSCFLLLASCVVIDDRLLGAIAVEDKPAPAQLLTIIALDVGQGDSTLLIGPDGSAGLIDAGPPEAGLTYILPALRYYGVNHLDWITISHYDADHLGGLIEVLQGEDQTWDTEDDITVYQAVWDRGAAPFTNRYWFGHYKAELMPRGLRHTVSIGELFDLGDGASATVVLVNGIYQNGLTTHINPDEENSASVALLIEYGSFRYLTAGDLTGGGFSGQLETKDLESALGDLIGDIDVLHLNHHGSHTSTNEHYLQTLAPEYAIISAGIQNDYGHPHAEVTKRLHNNQIDTYETKNGDIVITSDGASYRITQTPFSLKKTATPAPNTPAGTAAGATGRFSPFDHSHCLLKGARTQIMTIDCHLQCSHSDFC